MHAEEQKQAPSAPEIAPQADSVESKPKASNRGGKRPGAGRKPNLAKRLLKCFTRDTIALAVQEIGRPAQNVNLQGSMLHAHTIWRPLETLTDEELRLLESIYKKTSAPAVSNASPDAHQNQIESKPAIEAETATRLQRQRFEVSRLASGRRFLT